MRGALRTFATAVFVLTLLVNSDTIPAALGLGKRRCEHSVLRSILAYSTLAIVILWLVLSYLPRQIVSLPNLALHGSAAGSAYQWALIVSLLVFLAIQLWLVWATVGFFRSQSQARGASPLAFGLKLSSELFWTAIPLVMTIGLAIASYQTWLSLTAP